MYINYNIRSSLVRCNHCTFKAQQNTKTQTCQQTLKTRTMQIKTKYIHEANRPGMRLRHGVAALLFRRVLNTTSRLPNRTSGASILRWD